MNGIIIINKENGWTSNDVVQKVKHIFNEKVGHTGTLDPLANGVLPLLVGKGTLLSKYLVNHDKEYIATIKLGIKTETADSEGKIIERKTVTEKSLDEKNIKTVLETFVGKQSQIPPIYSAIKVDGKKLYDYARAGKSVNIQPRKIEIYKIELLNISKEKQEIKYKVKCSKGTYIRTLCEDIADKLGTVGFMKELTRTMVGNFKLDQAIKISDITNIDKNLLNNYIISIEDFFNDLEKIELDVNNITRFLNGTLINIKKIDGLYKIYDINNKFIGIGIIKNNNLKRDICI